jgi:hypothetical protein
MMMMMMMMIDDGDSCVRVKRKISPANQKKLGKNPNVTKLRNQANYHIFTKMHIFDSECF